MGNILDAADSIEVGRPRTCGLQVYLESLDDEGREDMAEVFRRAEQIPVGSGRYTYVQKVIERAGGPDFERQTISKHMNRADKCQRS